ncbi:hypothetical protein ACFB49_42410 [Sphingomonas sp. DBB INV C78]|uniref:hypothetical protein n=1 Tax=Sphingomonas sp. DBB INV C78 TaxID=3349434 RepID=UPI0036D358E8
MIPGAVLSGAGMALRALRRFWWAVPIIGLALALQVTRHTLAEAREDHQAYVDGMKAAQAAELAKRLETERARTVINQETDLAHRQAMDAQRARYEQRLRELTGRPDAALPRIPDPARSFDANACGDGLLSIPTETAVALMMAADDNTRQLLDLQTWVRRQIDVR